MQFLSSDAKKVGPYNLPADFISRIYGITYSGTIPLALSYSTPPTATESMSQINVDVDENILIFDIFLLSWPVVKFILQTPKEGFLKQQIFFSIYYST